MYVRYRNIFWFLGTFHFKSSDVHDEVDNLCAFLALSTPIGKILGLLLHKLSTINTPRVHACQVLKITIRYLLIKIS